MARLSVSPGPRIDRRQAILLNARRRRRAAENLDKFEGDVAAPFSMGTVAAPNPLPAPYPMRANARIAVSFSAVVAAGQLTLAVGSAVLKTPVLAANEIYRLEVAARDQDITPTSAIAGTVKIHVLDEWSRSSVVATGIFT